MIPLGPNWAFALTILGLLAIYVELIWPGRGVAAVMGVGAFLAGGYFLWLHSPSPLGVALLATAAALFAAEAAVDSFFVAGAAGTISMTFGFSRLFDRPPVIFPWLLVPLCLAFGAATGFLSYWTRRARSNKWERQPGTFNRQ